MLFKCLFMLTFLVLSVSEAEGIEGCFDNSVSYITCDPENPYHPSVCDCKDKVKCFIMFTITKNINVNQRGKQDVGSAFSINNGRIGPTIIIKQDATLVVDVINNLDVKTSIHWHGMHQKNTPWMDGVGMITQWPIKANGKFRYILKAHPSGTNWYHSHEKTQRDEGIFGALIVKEIDGVVDALNIKSIVDNPDQMIAITEHLKKPIGREKCLGSVSNNVVYSFQMNGIKLEQNVNIVTANQKPFFTVSHGNNYRFRVVGAVEETVFRISIDGHKLFVVATDGYLTNPYPVDVLHVHAGERYDFIVKSREIKDIAVKNVFPIRIESVEVICEHHDKPSRVGIAYLKYSISDGTATTVEDNKYSQNCIALNCPFGRYPNVALYPNAPSCKCYDVYDALSLLHPTPANELSKVRPQTPAVTKFINHAFYNGFENKFSARVNNIQFKFPKTPFAVRGEQCNVCPYQTAGQCKKCPHTVSVHKEHQSKPIEFVLSSLPRECTTDTVTKLVTHPIHLHGQSFWVKEIAYPEYSEEGKITKANDHINLPHCGHGSWRRGTRPTAITNVNETTIRKDTIIVPAGGYVVIEFLAVNPGWWLMHCHIDHHLLQGMGIVVAELPECVSEPPPNFLQETDEFCISVDDFEKKRTYYKCPENPTTRDEELPSELEKDEFEDFNSFNHRDDNDERAYNKLKKSILREFQNERGGPLDDESKEWYKKE